MNAGQAWDDLADKTERWAARVAILPKSTVHPESVDILHGQAESYRRTALAMRMTAETGVIHCCCTNPPHKL